MNKKLHLTAALWLLAPFAHNAYAACSANEVEYSFTEVECKDGWDPVGVLAKQGVQNVTVIVRNDGGIDTTGDAIQLNGGSKVDISGYVSSGSGIGVRLSGDGPQQVTINGFGQLLARTYGIFAPAGGEDGYVTITNFGLIGGPLNTGAIYASATRRGLIQNFGEIAVSGSGYGINLVGSSGADLLQVISSGPILAGSFGIRVQGSQQLRIDNSASVDAGGTALEARYGDDIEIKNSGNLTVRTGSGYGIYADGVSLLRQGPTVVKVTNTGDIVLGAETYQARGITAYAASGLHPDGWRWPGETTVVNHGNVTGLGSFGIGIESRGTDLASLVNTGTVSVLGGTGLSVAGALAQLNNNASITGGSGISISGGYYSGEYGRVELINSGDITALQYDGVSISGRTIEINNSGAITAPRTGLKVAASAGDHGGLIDVDIVNSGRIQSLSGYSAMDISASSLYTTQGRVSLINEGVLLSSDGHGIDVGAGRSINIDNRAAISSRSAAIRANVYHNNGSINILNSGALTAASSPLGYRLSASIASDRTGSIVVDNSGRIQGLGGIEAFTTAGTLTPLDRFLGDVTVTNSGEIFSSQVRAIDARAARGTATIHNSAYLYSDSSFSVLRASGLDAVVTNSGELHVDGRGYGIETWAYGPDGSIDIVNSGRILLDEKSNNGAGIRALVSLANGFGNTGRVSIENTEDIVSFGTRNRGIDVTTFGGGADINSNATISTQFDAIGVVTSQSGGDINLYTAGSVRSQEQSGVALRTTDGGNIDVVNNAMILAHAVGIQAAAPGGGAVTIANSGAITIGSATYNEYISYNNNTYGVAKAALYGLGDSVRIENHGLLQTTASSRRIGIGINTAAPGGVGEVINRGDILMNHAGFDFGTGISVSAGIGGRASVENFADVRMGRSSTGIELYGRAGTHLSLLNDGLVESDTYYGVLVSGEATTTSRVHNDKGGHIVSQSSRAFNGSAGNDHLINAGVIRTNSTSDSVGAVNLAGGDDIMEMIGLSEIHGRVDGGTGTDTLRWGGDVIGRFDMGLVGDQYINFEQFEKTGSSIWIYDGVSTAIDHLQVREGTARVNGTLDGDVTVAADAIFGGTGTVLGDVFIDNGGIYAPGSSIGTQALGNLTLGGSQSVFQLELDAGGLFDQVNVSGTATLGGILDILFLDSSGFHVGWQAIFLESAALLGAFEGYRVSGLSGRAQFDLFMDNGRVGLVLTDFDASAVPLPASIWLLGSGLALFGLQRRRSH